MISQGGSSHNQDKREISQTRRIPYTIRVVVIFSWEEAVGKGIPDREIMRMGGKKRQRAKEETKRESVEPRNTKGSIR